MFCSPPPQNTPWCPTGTMPSLTNYSLGCVDWLSTYFAGLIQMSAIVALVSFKQEMVKGQSHVMRVPKKMVDEYSATVKDLGGRLRKLTQAGPSFEGHALPGAVAVRLGLVLAVATYPGFTWPVVAATFGMFLVAPYSLPVSFCT